MSRDHAIDALPVAAGGFEHGRHRAPKPTGHGPGRNHRPPADTTDWPRRRAALRLLGLLRPSKRGMFLAVAATCAFVALNVAAPKYLGDATDVVVAGFVGGRLDEAQLASLLLAVALMYLGASLFSWLQGTLTAAAVQRVGYGLRASVEAKLHRLPSAHFEAQRRGEVLGRATHDVDIIAQALNQLLNQFILSVLMLSGALAMMLWLSPVLALIALVSVPVSALITITGGAAVEGTVRGAVEQHRRAERPRWRISSPAMKSSKPSDGRARRRPFSAPATTSSRAPAPAPSSWPGSCSR